VKLHLSPRNSPPLFGSALKRELAFFLKEDFPRKILFFLGDFLFSSTFFFEGCFEKNFLYPLKNLNKFSKKKASLSKNILEKRGKSFSNKK
jgi:hypothetical protein